MDPYIKTELALSNKTWSISKSKVSID